MTDPLPMTAEEFIDARPEMPEYGQWTELVAGQPVFLGLPDTMHGITLWNFTKVLAAHLQATQDGYACFEMGLLLSQNPDTVRFSAACYFNSGPLFAESDQLYTQTRPALVFEIASSKLRRTEMQRRVDEYLEWGIETVWVADPVEETFYDFGQGRKAVQLAGGQSIVGDPLLAGFSLPVEELFARPQP